MTQEQTIACYLRELSSLLLATATDIENYGHISHDAVKIRALLAISEQIRTAHLHLANCRYQQAQRVIERVRLELKHFDKRVSVG
ncbi:MAG: hypothetical protein IGS23_14035 [Rivularia sp. T60_A2020_040]|nr:hypothetical protein [Rivularia sp. T60_A2020_040]